MWSYIPRSRRDACSIASSCRRSVRHWDLSTPAQPTVGTFEFTEHEKEWADCFTPWPEEVLFIAQNALSLGGLFYLHLILYEITRTPPFLDACWSNWTKGKLSPRGSADILSTITTSDAIAVPGGQILLLLFVASEKPHTQIYLSHCASMLLKRWSTTQSAALGKRFLFPTPLFPTICLCAYCRLYTMRLICKDMYL